MTEFSMQGFDPKFKDPADYIIGITKEIWEDRRISLLNQYYADDIVVRSPASVVVGNTGVIAATMATLAEFPDRELLGEDVIWCPAPSVGFLSSHRLLCTATHTGPGVYGEPTGKKLKYRILADCHTVANQINDEWLVRDQGAIVQTMGWDIKAYAEDLIAREGGPEACVKPLTPATDQPGPYKGQGNDNPLGQRYADILSRIMSADMAVIPQEYDRAVVCEYPSNVSGQSHRAADQHWMGLRAAFPNADFKIHHAIGRDDPDMPPRAAVRWSLHGKHEGWGAFGTPTGAQVYVMGISHAEFGPWGLRREYSLYDETAIWKQILLKTG